MARSRYLLLFASIAALAGAMAACSGEQAQPPGPFLQESLLASLDFPPPPSAGSKAEALDRAEMRRWQGLRTGAQCAEAGVEGADPSFRTFFGRLAPFGPGLPPEMEAFVSEAGREAAGSAGRLKSRFGRPRPFKADPALRPCIEEPSDTSYPSGHAAMSRMHALVLSEAFPSRRTELLERADAVALNRVIGGVHYPSDIQAGKDLADALFVKMRGTPSFREELRKLKAFAVKSGKKAPGGR